jgi:glycosyltransferase involved in cell wall biosynthesis
MVVPHELSVKGGGISNHAQHLSKNLIKLGHRIEVIALSEQNQHFQTNDLTIHNVASYYLPPFPYASLAGFTVPNNFFTIKKLITEIIHQGVDVIHTHGHHYPSTWYAILLAYKYHLPCVLTLHGTTGLDHEYPFASLIETAFNRTILSSILQKVNAVIGLSPNVTNYMRTYSSATTQFFTIPNGIYLNQFQENLHNKILYRKKYGLPLDKTILLFRGRFAAIKGILELLTVLPSFLAQHSDIFFLFVGDGPLRKQILHTAEIVGETNMMVSTWTPYSDLHELYIASDIYILPSKQEALPITILEAMASRLHIVATPVGGIPDVLSPYPWKTYIRNASPNAIVNGLTHTISKYAITRSEKNITKYNKHIHQFDWTTISKETEKIYQKLIP